MVHRFVTRHELGRMTTIQWWHSHPSRRSRNFIGKVQENDHKRSQRRACRHPSNRDRGTCPPRWPRSVRAAARRVPDVLPGNRGADRARFGRQARRLEAGHHPGARSAVRVRSGSPQDRSAGSPQRAGAAHRDGHGFPAGNADDPPRCRLHPADHRGTRTGPRPHQRAGSSDARDPGRGTTRPGRSRSPGTHGQTPRPDGFPGYAAWSTPSAASQPRVSPAPRDDAVTLPAPGHIRPWRRFAGVPQHRRSRPSQARPAALFCDQSLGNQHAAAGICDLPAKPPELPAGRPVGVTAAEDRTAHPHPGRAAGDRDLEIGRHAHRQHGQPVARRAVGQPGEMRSRVLVCGGTHISPISAAPKRPLQSSMNPSAWARATPDFCGSSPIFTSISSAACGLPWRSPRPCASASFGRSSVSITSAIRTASRALLVCRPPMMCSDRRVRGAQRGKLARGLLHPVLAEHASARRRAPRAPPRPAWSWTPPPG